MPARKTATTAICQRCRRQCLGKHSQRLCDEQFYQNWLNLEKLIEKKCRLQRQNHLKKCRGCRNLFSPVGENPYRERYCYECK